MKKAATRAAFSDDSSDVATNRSMLVATGILFGQGLLDGIVLEILHAAFDVGHEQVTQITAHAVADQDTLNDQVCPMSRLPGPKFQAPHHCL